MATLKEQQRLWESLMVREPNREDPPYRPWGPSHPDHPDYGKKPKLVQRNNMKIASTPQGGAYPTTPSYINYKEIRDINPFLIDKFIRDRGLEIFKLQTGIPLAHGDGGGWEHWDAETKKRFLMETDDEYKQWLKDNNFIEEDKPDIKKSLKIGKA
jgi:hypothetical protein